MAKSEIIAIERKLIGIVTRARVGFRVYVIGVVECVIAHAHSDHRYPDGRLAACDQRAERCVHGIVGLVRYAILDEIRQVQADDAQIARAVQLVLHGAQERVGFGSRFGHLCRKNPESRSQKPEDRTRGPIHLLAPGFWLLNFSSVGAESNGGWSSE